MRRFGSTNGSGNTSGVFDHSWTLNSKFAAILRSTLRLGTDRTTDFRRPLRVHASGYTHTRTHTHTYAHLCPQRIFPRFGMFRLGIRGAPPRAVLTDDTINQQFLFSSLLVSGRRTFQRNYFQGREATYRGVTRVRWTGRKPKLRPLYAAAMDLIYCL